MKMVIREPKNGVPFYFLLQQNQRRSPLCSPNSSKVSSFISPSIRGVMLLSCYRQCGKQLQFSLFFNVDYIFALNSKVPVLLAESSWIFDCILFVLRSVYNPFKFDWVHGMPWNFRIFHIVHIHRKCSDCLKFDENKFGE